MLGALLVRPAAIRSPGLTAELFTEPRHRAILAALAALDADGAPVDTLTLRDRLEAAGDLDRAGGVAYLAALDLDLPDADRLPVYLATLAAHARRRAVVALCERTAVEAADLRRGDAEVIARHRADLDAAVAAFPAADPPELSAAELLALDAPERPWLVEDFLRAGDLAGLIARRGTAKTWFALALALAVATGRPFLRWRVPESLPVLVVDGELPEPDLRARWAALAGEHSAAPVYFLSAAAMHRSGRPLANLATPEGQAVVEAAAERRRAALVILDSISTLAPSRPGESENAAEDWAARQGLLTRLRWAGRAVLVAHHTGKSGDQRGTSAREDLLDLALLLERPEDALPHDGARAVVRFAKARGLVGEQVRPLDIALRPSPDGLLGWTWQAAGEGSPVEQIAAYLDSLNGDGEPSCREIARALGLGKSTVGKYLSSARRLVSAAPSGGTVRALPDTRSAPR